MMETLGYIRFEVSRSREHQDKIDYFNTLCDNLTLQQAFANKQLYGCSYPDSFEAKLKPFINQVEDKFELPHWLWLLD
jgi:hypothetical protein